MAKKSYKIYWIIGIVLVIGIIMYTRNNTMMQPPREINDGAGVGTCDEISFNKDSSCICPTNTIKENYNVVCVKAPCPSDTFYRCRFLECKINSDCLSGQCSGNGRCI